MHFQLTVYLQVIVPVFADQPANAKEAEIKGFGLSLPLMDITTEKLYYIIQKVLTNPRYSQRAKEHGSLLMDDITNPLDRAVWWIEYALRHPGVEHLRWAVS
jgi:glucuronosyltransferase